MAQRSNRYSTDDDRERKISVVSNGGSERKISIINQVNPEQRKISVVSQTNPESDISSTVIISNFQEEDPELAKPIDDLDLPVPPDGGWGWVVVVASLFVNIIVDGVCFSFGIMFVELLEYYGESKGKTMWIGSLIPGMYLGTGPIVGALANRYGCRSVTIIGSIIAAVSFFLSTYSPNVNVMIITYGIMGGLGFGLMYLPSIVIVGFYFNQKRALATGLAVCGSGIGTFIFAPFTRYLLAEYGWKGANWIIAGIILNGIAMGFVFRPLKKPSEIEKERKKQELKKQDKRKKDRVDLKPSFIIQKIIEEKKRQRTVSTGSLDGTYITRDNTLVRDADIVKLLELKDSRLTKVLEEDEETHDGMGTDGESMADIQINNIKNTIAQDTVSLVDDAERQSRSGSRESFINDVRSRSSSPYNRPRKISVEKSAYKMSNGSVPGTPPVYRRLERIKDQELGMRPRANTTGSSNRPKRGPNCIGSVPELSGRHKKDFVGSQRSMLGSRVDITSFTSSLGSIPVPLFTNSTKSIMTMTDASGEERQTTWKERLHLVVDLLKEMFNFSLLKNMTFSLLCIASILAMLGFFVPFFYVVDCALKLGISFNTATFLLSVIGIANTVGRILVGWMSDRPWADCLIIHNVALIIGGIATGFVPFMPNYVILCIYCATFGFCIAAYIALRSIVLVELLGVEKLTQSFGLLLLFQGIASIIGPPTAGMLGDITGSYNLSFYVAGVVLTLAGLICLPIRRIAHWENNRRRLEEHCYSHVNSNNSDV